LAQVSPADQTAVLPARPVPSAIIPRNVHVSAMASHAPETG